jgi:hypothetical protein
VFRAEATDDDLGMTCPLHGPGESPATCPCATSRFKMLHGADSTLFNVDNETGDVFLAEGTYLQPGREYHFTVEAHGKSFLIIGHVSIYYRLNTENGGFNNSKLKYIYMLVSYSKKML